MSNTAEPGLSRVEATGMTTADTTGEATKEVTVVVTAGWDTKQAMVVTGADVLEEEE